MHIAEAPLDDSNARIAGWRPDTPGCASRIHLNNAGAALMPRQVVEAIRDHIDLEARIGGYEAAAEREAAIAECYESVATLCGTRAGNIAFTASATAAFVQAISGHTFQPGDVLITSRLDYTSYQIQYLALAERYGVKIVHAPDLPEGGIDPDAVRALLRQHPTCRFVSVSWIPTHAGTIQDVAAVGEVCDAAGVPFHVDACQAIGQLPIDLATLKCDYLSATGRKFLRGPRGTGFLYVSDQALARGARPLFIDMRGAVWSSADRFTPVKGARRFEEWEFAYALLLGLGEAARYASSVGVEAGGLRARAIATYIRERLGAMNGVTILDRGTELSALVTASVAGFDGGDIARALGARGINVVATRQWFGLLDFGPRGVESGVRISPHYYNTFEEADTLLAALREVSVARVAPA
jgi:selenocysteine lyase/cysteine desulfurase